MGKNVKPEDVYKKHIYWLKASQEARLREELLQQNIKLKKAKGIVCAPLDRINKIASVSPIVWNSTCARQGSWYRQSERNGQFLIVSSFELKGYEKDRSAMITETTFEPPKLATKEDTEELFQDEKLRERMPEAWKKVQEMEKRIYLRWARRLGAEPSDYEALYHSHTANHANFIHPRFFIEDSHGLIPYSINRTAWLCSCCVELFQVLGGEYHKKLVAPCPGATIFARLKPDKYLLVENTEKECSG
ncbi:MAG: hypothetical protein MUP26_00780 [Desulfobulbaceae bacterium]|nr:hypothetical protein [Desulfobulbaceae bacterium]